jgi:hypothetical protein
VLDHTPSTQFPPCETVIVTVRWARLAVWSVPVQLPETSANGPAGAGEGAGACVTELPQLPAPRVAAARTPIRRIRYAASTRVRPISTVPVPE